MAHTQEELEAMKLAELKELATSDYDLDIKGLRKAGIIDAILEHEADEPDDEVDDEELDDDEVEDSDEVDEDDELDDDLEPDEDEVDDEPEPAPKKPKAKPKKAADPDGESTLAAKQVAALLNTDAKTLRQFFRSPSSTVEPCGSGGRYEFYESDVDKIRNEFATWSENKKTRAKSEGGTTKRKRKERVIPDEEIAPEIEELDDELDELEDELEDELDDDELDD